MEPHERKVQALLQQLNTLKNDQTRIEKEKKSLKRKKYVEEKRKEEAKQKEKQQEQKKKFFRMKSKMEARAKNRSSSTVASGKSDAGDA